MTDHSRLKGWKNQAERSSVSRMPLPDQSRSFNDCCIRSSTVCAVTGTSPQLGERDSHRAAGRAFPAGVINHMEPSWDWAFSNCRHPRRLSFSV